MKRATSRGMQSTNKREKKSNKSKFVSTKYEIQKVISRCHIIKHDSTNVSYNQGLNFPSMPEFSLHYQFLPAHIETLHVFANEINQSN
jgi:hypothetical protein